MVSKDFRRQLEGYGLTTARILYRRPDHLWLLQTYVWQDYDLFPNFPTLQKFLAFWQKSLEGPVALGDGRAFAPDQAGGTAARSTASSACTEAARRAGRPARSLRCCLADRVSATASRTE